MKQKRILFLILLSALCVVLLCSCGFVKYVEYSDQSNRNDDLDTALEEYIKKIDSLVSADDYREEERFTLAHLILDAKNELRECTDTEQLLATYEKHESLILGVPTDLTLSLNELLEEFGILVDLSDYRESEQKQIEQMILHYTKKIKEAETKEEAERLVRQFQTELYEIKTDAQYTLEELNRLKNEKIEQLSSAVNYGLYRTADRERIQALISQRSLDIRDAESQDEVNSLFELCLQSIDATPTITEALQSDRATWTESWNGQIDAFLARNPLPDGDTAKNEILAQISQAKSKEEAARYGASFLIENTNDLSVLHEAVDLYLTNAITKGDYRSEQIGQANGYIQAAREQLLTAQNKAQITEIWSTLKTSIADLDTNDELWAAEDTQFMQELTQNFVYFLAPPQSMTQANSYEELAAIIDYYAFYQKDSSSFLRGTFRVELTFPHKWAQWEINEVYWYCELIRSAVGITGYFEKDSSCFVITLIPYDIASESNADSPIQTNRFENVLTYESNSTLQDRSDDFEDFPYLSLYTKRLTGIWNTQQLWYALEHEYIPETVDGSPADICLKQAKEILREIIKDGMTIEEKVYAIYSWFGRNVAYDHAYTSHLYPADRDLFPDSLAAKLNSFHIEGALLDNLAVCCAYAKSCLLLMRIEGLEAYRVFIHRYRDNAIGNLGNTGFGSHAIVAVRASDGKFYYCDVERSSIESPSPNNPVEPRMLNFHQILVSKDVQYPYNDGWTPLYQDFDFGKSFPSALLWDHLTYNGMSVFVKTEAQLKALLDAFAAETKTDIQLTVFTYGDTSFSVPDVLLNDTRFASNYYSFEFGGLAEYIIYK